MRDAPIYSGTGLNGNGRMDEKEKVKLNGVKGQEGTLLTQDQR